MLLANQLSQTQAATISTSNTAVVAVSLSLFAIIALFIMVPAALRALRTQKVIFDALLEVPQPIVGALKDRVAFKVEQARKEEEAAALGLDADDAGADDIGLAPPIFEDEERLDLSEKIPTGSLAAGSTGDALQNAINAAAQKRARAEGLAAAASSSNLKGGLLCCARSDGERLRKRSSQRHYRRAASSRNVVLLGMLWPVVVYCAYFIGSYFWRVQLVTFAAFAKEEVWWACALNSNTATNVYSFPASRHSQVLWSKQIQFYSGQLGFNIRSAYAYCAPAFVETNLARATKSANLMVQMMDDVLYGSSNPDRSVRPGLQVSSSTFTLMMVRAA